MNRRGIKNVEDGADRQEKRKTPISYIEGQHAKGWCDRNTRNTLGKDLTCLFADSNEFRINTDCDAVRSRRHGKGSVVCLRAHGHCHKSSRDSNNVKWFAQKQR